MVRALAGEVRKLLLASVAAAVAMVGVWVAATWMFGRIAETLGAS